MRRLVLGSLIALAGCAERDNPWDPVNRAGTLPGAPALPVPGPGVKVVLPDSASRDPDNPYFANVQSALVLIEPGDTVWIQGGRSYALSSELRMVLGGTKFRPVVIRSFGGEARFFDAGKDALSSLMTLNGPGYVEIKGLAFVRGTGAGFRANGLQGPLRMDSCRFDSNGTYGLETRGLRDALVLRHLRLRGNGQVPGLSVEPGVDSVEVRLE